MRILIIRHGEPNYEKDCLIEQGKRQAKLLADRLKNERMDYIFTSPLGRAKETCFTWASAVGREEEVVVKDWLREFDHEVTFPSGRKHHIAWDMLPEEWLSEEKLYHYKDWITHDCYKNSGLQEYYQHVVTSLDEVLANHGYVRDGNGYRVEKANRDTLVFFCHFGVECVLLSRLCNISPISLWHNFVAFTTSVTTLYTEERRPGKAVFRCTGFGDVNHLYSGNEAPSFNARFCETYDCKEERHD